MGKLSAITHRGTENRFYRNDFRMGMLPELILNEDEKKERFRKHLAKKKRQSEQNIIELEAAETIQEEENKSFILLQNRPPVINNPILSAIFNFEINKIAKMDYSRKNIQLNEVEKTSVSQVLPIIGNIIHFPQRTVPLNLSLRNKEEEKRTEEADTKVTLGKDDSMSGMLQLIRKDFEAIKYFSQKRNLQFSNIEASTGKIVDRKVFENISGNRKSVIFHTSDLNKLV